MRCISRILLILCCLAATMAFADQESPYREVIGSQGGEVLDTRTGLVWKRCLIGKVWDAATSRCSGSPADMPWDTLIDHVKKLPRAGDNDWRLPTPFELMSIVDSVCQDRAGCDKPSMDPKWLGDADAVFLWSDAAYVRMPDYAWGIRGKRGELSYELKNDAFQARLVKSKL